MTDIENNGVQTLSDDELDAVAGGAPYQGAMHEVHAANLAKKDGRTFKLPDPRGICYHREGWIYAKTKEENDVSVTYRDIKCYGCGTRYPSFTVSK